MINCFNVFFESYISVFFIFNAFMNIFIIISFTPHMNFIQRQNTIRKSMLVAAAAVFLFAIIGQLMLDVLNVTMSAMKLTGAILIGPAAYDMVVGHSIDNKKEHKNDMHFFPIGVPTLAGPGVFTTVLMILKNGGAADLIPSILGIIAALFTTYFVVNTGNRFFSTINSSYIRMMSVFFGTILLALSAQFFIDGMIMVSKLIIK
ncbi:MarC family protein [Candidatus Cytomitobacter primus]|uniref:UPF0056 membrane protein n=1 Tax=Candidatus Cytomitobacter primus TaxID=2066024 RepID=A0A5C0UH25_9PROT|nr:MarC family protein [Candidatus Cytomitobacter primus]QEK38602.1 MarC family protein [Candidatus Cytomitobacter primus]